MSDAGLCFDKVICSLVLVTFIAFFFLGLFFIQPVFVSAPVADCAVTSKVLRVHGDSMRPLFEPETEHTLLEGYYDCHPVLRGDVVVHQYASNLIPLVKSVRAVAGDTLMLTPAQSRTSVMSGKWNVIINDKILVNDSKAPYAISLAGYRMLSLYIKDYRGLIPRGSVLLLGEDPKGSIDGTRLGLTSVSDLIGKVKN